MRQQQLFQTNAVEQVTSELAGTRTAGETRDRQAQAEADELRGQLAAVQVRLAGARAEVGRERSMGYERVADLHSSNIQQLSLLRAELAEARQGARSQRSRSDKADTQRVHLEQ